MQFSSTGISGAELIQGCICAVLQNEKRWKLAGSLVLSVLPNFAHHASPGVFFDWCPIPDVLFHAGWFPSFQFPCHLVRVLVY